MIYNLAQVNLVKYLRFGGKMSSSQLAPNTLSDSVRIGKLVEYEGEVFVEIVSPDIGLCRVPDSQISNVVYADDVATRFLELFADFPRVTLEPTHVGRLAEVLAEDDEAKPREAERSLPPEVVARKRADAATLSGPASWPAKALQDEAVKTRPEKEQARNETRAAKRRKKGGTNKTQA